MKHEEALAQSEWLKEYDSIINLVKNYVDMEIAFGGSCPISEKKPVSKAPQEAKVTQEAKQEKSASVNAASLSKVAATAPANLSGETTKAPVQSINVGASIVAQENSASNLLTVANPVLKQLPDASKEEKVVSIEKSAASSKEERIAPIKKEALACTKCKLCKTRSQVVFGSGSLDAKLVIVGEAPGFNEDQQGLPFVGDAGQLLTKMLAGIGLAREEVYICNVIKCRPPGNRPPEADEIVACRPWLAKQLQIIAPTLICGMGKFASYFLTDIQQSMWQYRGQTYSYEGIPVICTYHPAYLIRNTDPVKQAEEKKKVWEDLKRVKETLKQLLKK